MPKKYAKNAIRLDQDSGSIHPIRSAPHLIGNLNRFIWDAAGLACLVLAVLSFLGLADLTSGIVLIWWADLLSQGSKSTQLGGASWHWRWLHFHRLPCSRFSAVPLWNEQKRVWMAA